MKTILVALAAVATVSAAAVPAAAQPYGARPDFGRHEAYNINHRQERLETRIERGLRNGSLTRREASRLRAGFRDVARLEVRYRVNGLSRWERADLDRRLDHLEARVRIERNDPQYGWRR